MFTIILLCKSALRTKKLVTIAVLTSMFAADNFTYCYNSTMDIAFIIDDSSNIGSSNWNIVKQFIGQVVDKFYVSPDHIRFAAIQYSSDAFVAFPFSQSIDNANLRNAVSSLQYRGSSILRNLSSAFTLAWSGLFQTQARRNVDMVGWWSCASDERYFDESFS